MIPTHLIRSLAVSAASGLVLHDGVFHVVADDELSLYSFGLHGETQRTPLLPGELPSAHKERKAAKPDFEILFDLPGRGLLAMGSGSRASRMRAVMIDSDQQCTVIDTTPLCTELMAMFPELNLEGAIVGDDALVLLQRGNRSDRRNALIFVNLADLQQAIETARFNLLSAPRIVDLNLGQHNDIPWSCTDITLLTDGDFLISAVLENTGNAYDDGACLGSSLARLSSSGVLKWHLPLDAVVKVEGIAAAGGHVWLVSDADDRSQPSQLRHAMLP